MKTILFCLLALSSIVSAEVTKVTLLSDSTYPPYAFVEQGEVTGMYIDIVKAVSNQLPDYNIEIKPFTWEQAKNKIEHGEALGLIGMYFTGDLRPYTYPYSQSLWTETVIVLCQPGKITKTDAKWPQDYAGMLVGNVAGYDTWLNDNPRNPEYTTLVNFLEVPDSNIALNMLIKKRLDCVLFEKGSFLYSIAKIKKKQAITPDNMPIITSVIEKESVHIGYSDKAFHSSGFTYAYDFQKKFDFALLKLKESGKFNQITKKYQ